MSLDSVELVMEFEETFDITIPERAAEKIVTVGDAIRYIEARVELSDTAPCLTASAFYRLRRALMETCGVERTRVRPASCLEEMIPRTGRQDRWAQLGSALGTGLPDLVRPERMRLRLSGAVLAWFLMTLSVTLASAATLAGPFAFGLVALSVVAGCCCLAAAFRLTRPYAIELTPCCWTVGALSETLAVSLAGDGLPQERRWSRATVREAVRAIVVKRLGVSPEVVTDDASFVHDLGVD